MSKFKPGDLVVLNENCKIQYAYPLVINSANPGRISEIDKEYVSVHAEVMDFNVYVFHIDDLELFEESSIEYNGFKHGQDYYLIGYDEDENPYFKDCTELNLMPGSREAYDNKDKINKGLIVHDEADAIAKINYDDIIDSIVKDLREKYCDHIDCNNHNNCRLLYHHKLVCPFKDVTYEGLY